jgi:hypothetical protein
MKSSRQVIDLCIRAIIRSFTSRSMRWFMACNLFISSGYITWTSTVWLRGANPSACAITVISHGPAM